MTTNDRDLISLQQAADRLGVHYMTAYRYVRTGRLPATREQGQWMVDPAVLSTVAAGSRAPRASAGERKGTTPARAAERLARGLIRGDEAAAWQQVQDQLAYGRAPEALYLEVLGPAMRAVGDGWASGAIDVGEEHRASAVMQRLIGRLGPLFATRGRRRGTIVLGGPPRERHAIPISLLADPLRGRHFEVVDLGADVPVESFAEAAAEADRLLGVGVCATTASERAIRQTIKAVREATPVPVLLGGAAVPDADTAARFGADHYSPDAAEALAFFESLATGARS